MAQDLVQVSIEGPGSQGLNSEISPYQQTAEFALKADNAVIDRIGRLAAREAFSEYIKRNDFKEEAALGDNQVWDIVRMEDLQPQGQPTPPVPVPKPNLAEFNSEPATEFYDCQFNGTQIEHTVPLTRMARTSPNQYKRNTDNEYVTGIFTNAEFDGRNNLGYLDDRVVFCIIGIGTGKTDSVTNAPLYDRYICASLTREGLKTIKYTQGEYAGKLLSPTNGLNNCQVVPFRDSFYIFSYGDAPMVYNANGTAENLSDVAGYIPPRDDDFVYAPELNGDVATAAYGRLWVSGVGGDYNRIYYSDLLIAHQWYDGTTNADGSAGEDSQNTGGFIDVGEYWPHGSDSVQAIAAHNGALFVFGVRSILAYSGADGDPAGDPSTGAGGLKLEDTIKDVGIVAQDALCNIGTDLLFVDSMGVRSLGRVIQEKSTPISEPSLNVATVIRQDIAIFRESIRLLHFSSRSLVVCLIPGKIVDEQVGVSYVFQLGQPSISGGLKVTRWLDCDFLDAVTIRTPLENNELLGGRNGRGVTAYYNYEPQTKYRLAYESTTLLGGDQLMRKLVPKSVSFSYKSKEANNLVIKWGFGSNPLPFLKKVKNKSNAPEFTTNKVNLSASGEMLRIGFETDILPRKETGVAGYGFSMQNVSVNTLVGRLIV